MGRYSSTSEARERGRACALQPPFLKEAARAPKSAWRPGAERLPDLPFVPEWIADSAHPPAMLVCHRSELGRSRGHGLGQSGIGVVDNEQRPARRAIDRARAEPFHR